MLLAQVVDTKMKVDHLEAKLAHASKSQREASIAKGRPPRSESEPLATKEVWGSSTTINEVHLQGYNFDFDVCELIMWDLLREHHGV